MEELKQEITKSLVCFQLLEIALNNRLSDLYEIIQERTADVMSFKTPSVKNKTMGQLTNLLSELDSNNVFLPKLRELVEARNLVAHAAFAQLILGEENEINNIQVNIEKWITETLDIAITISSQNTKHYESKIKEIEENLKIATDTLDA